MFVATSTLGGRRNRLDLWFVVAEMISLLFIGWQSPGLMRVISFSSLLIFSDEVAYGVGCCCAGLPWSGFVVAHG